MFFVGRYNWLNCRFLHHLWTKVSQLNVPVMMLVPHCSLKSWKTSKNLLFVGRYYSPKDSFLKFFLEKANFAHFVSSPFGENLLKHLFWQKVSFESIKTSKTWNGKSYLFGEFLDWWKSTQTLLLTKIRDFEYSESSKTQKCKLYSVFQMPAW